MSAFIESITSYYDTSASHPASVKHAKHQSRDIEGVETGQFGRSGRHGLLLRRNMRMVSVRKGDE